MTELILNLITGRSIKQGIGISTGKERSEYREATCVIELCPSDMARMGLNTDDQVRLTSQFGTADVKCRQAEVPEGLAFMAFGPACNRLIGGETYASGMPDSKLLKVKVRPLGTNEGFAPDRNQKQETGSFDI